MLQISKEYCANVGGDGRGMALVVAIVDGGCVCIFPLANVITVTMAVSIVIAINVAFITINITTNDTALVGIDKQPGLLIVPRSIGL